MSKDQQEFTYTCNEYREEMILVTLHKRLQQDGLTAEEKDLIKKEIKRVEEQMGL